MAGLMTPNSLDELAACLAIGNVRVVAGGTDWFVRDVESFGEEDTLIDLSGVAELRGVTLQGGGLRIGAGETMTSLAGSPLVRTHAACLAEAAEHVGSWQIRNRATLGGNLAGGSPAADTPPALMALDATAEILSLRGTRSCSVEGIVAQGRAALAPDEVLVAFTIPLPEGRISAFGKVGSRKEVSIARLNLAASLRRSGGSLSNARVVVGTLGSAGRLCPGAGEILIGSLDLEERRRAFCSALVAVVEAAIPGRSTLPYKRSAILALGEDVFDALMRTSDEGRGRS